MEDNINTSIFGVVHSAEVESWWRERMMELIDDDEADYLHALYSEFRFHLDVKERGESPEP
jgi:hypothetical protein